MKNFTFKLIVICLFLISTKQYGQCPDPVNNSDYFFFTNGAYQLRFTTQAQLNQFAIDFPNCTSIDYHVVISGSGFTSVLPLQNITHVKRLSITDAVNLISLNGLQNLTSVSGQLYIKNSGLSNLQGLHNLASIGNTNDSSIGNNLLLETNSSLTSIAALSNLTYLGGLSLTVNHVLNSLTGLENIQSEIPGSVSINGGIVFSSMEALDGITSVGGNLMVKDCPSLVSLSGLDALTSVGGQLQITNNDALVSLVSLENVNSAGDLLINANENLVSIEALAGMTSVDLGINIANNPNLASLNGLQNVALAAGDPNYINSGVYIGYNHSLTSLNGLQGIVNLTGLADHIFISYNNNLTSLNGLNNLNSVRKLKIDHNPLLPSLEGLENLTVVEKLDLLNNNSLTTLDGLENHLAIKKITIPGISTTPTLQIRNNPLLPFCSIAPVCKFLSANGSSIIDNNSNICNSIPLVLANCPICPAVGDVIFTSQLQLNDFINNYPSCTEINGNLTIGSFDGNTDIINLSPLQNIIAVNGSLVIFNNPLLQNLNGLNALETVNGNLTIGSGNEMLENISSLSNLESINGYLQVLFNPLLTSLDGLQNVDPLTITGIGLNIIGNENLTICNLPNICEYIAFDANLHPRTISGNAIGCASIAGLQSACAALYCPEGNLSFTSQALLNQFILDYPNCTQITGNVFISGATITDLSPLANITSITGSFTMHFCANLLTLTPLENLTTITGDVYLSTLINLNSFNGLQNLTNVGGNLSVVSNNLLPNLEGLHGISSINNAYIYIANNPILTSLTGLQNLNIDNVTHLYLQNNATLSNCSMLPNICKYLHNNDTATISGNVGECLNTVTLLDACPTIWNGTNWNLDEPDENRNAIIEGNLTLATDLNTKNITLNSGVFIVPSEINVTVNGAVINNGIATNFIVESGGSLNQTNNVQNLDAVTIRRNSFPLYRQDYDSWSSPVQSQNLRSFSPLTLFNRFYTYNTSAGTNGEFAQELFNNQDVQNKTFESAKGYLIRMPNNWPQFINSGTLGTSFPAEFKGIPNNGAISVDISTSNTGLNFVGNPYPSPLSISSFFDGNVDIARTLYFWRKRNDALGSGYATYTELGLTSSQPELSGMDLENTINTGQGFFIKSNGQTTLNFNNSMRTTIQNTLFLKNNTTEKHRIWLNLSKNETLVSQTLIGYMSGATQAYDVNYDGLYFNDSSTALTSLIENQELAVQARSIPFDNNDIVPLAFKTNQSGTYNIALSQFDGLFNENQEVFLKDNFNGNLHDLKLSEYSFNTNEGNFNTRFSIVYKSNLGVNNPEMDASQIIVYKKKEELNINSGKIMMQKIELIDVMGRLIETHNTINQTNVKIDTQTISNQVVLIKITTTDNRVVTKKMVL